MARTPMALADRDAANRYGWVLILLGVAYVTSVSADGAAGVTVVMLVQLVTLWLTFSASESPKARRIAGTASVIVGLLAVSSALFGLVVNYDSLAVRIIAIVSVLLYLIAPAVILRHLIRRDVVDARTILGAIAIYVMMGMMFAFSYRAIGLFQHAQPFFGDSGTNTNANYLFFSFITLTTTGYGNLVPQTNPGQSLAVLEAIVGQLFLVTALAKIVNAWRVPNLGGNSGQAPDQ